MENENDQDEIIKKNKCEMNLRTWAIYKNTRLSFQVDKTELRMSKRNIIAHA